MKLFLFREKKGKKEKERNEKIQLYIKKVKIIFTKKKKKIGAQNQKIKLC